MRVGGAFTSQVIVQLSRVVPSTECLMSMTGVCFLQGRRTGMGRSKYCFFLAVKRGVVYKLSYSCCDGMKRGGIHNLD